MNTGAGWIIEHSRDLNMNVKFRVIERGKSHLRSLSCEHTDGSEDTAETAELFLTHFQTLSEK